jgi:hypothetical protein
MADLRVLKLALLAETKDFIKGLDLAEKNTKSFSDKLRGGLKKAALAFAALGAAAGAAAIKIGKDAIEAASDFSEELSKSNVILGDAAKDVQKFAATAAKSLGQSKTEALKAAGNFAIFGKSAGLSGKALGKFSTDFTSLASDLASFNNTSPEDAVQALGAALRGESEPIRRYGVLLNEATLKQRALELGIIDNIKNALTPQQKVLAAQAEIFAQTSDAQGDFARTSDGLANQQRILKASLEDVKIALGEQLLPTAVKVGKFILETLVPALQGLVRGLTGGPNSVQASGVRTADGLERFAGTLNQNDEAAFGLGTALRGLAKSIQVLFSTAEEGTSEESGLIRFIRLLERIVAAIDSLIAKIDVARAKLQAFIDLSSRVVNTIGLQGPLAATERAGERFRAGVGNAVNNIQVNVKGAMDINASARQIVNVISKATTSTGLTFTQRAALR